MTATDALVSVVADVLRHQVPDGNAEQVARAVLGAIDTFVTSAAHAPRFDPPPIRVIPAEFEPVAAQAMLNLAAVGLLDPIQRAVIFEHAESTNTNYDAWKEIWA